MLEEIDPSYLSPEINMFFQAFPFTPPVPTAPVQLMIESFLPPISRGTALCENFLESVTWLARVVSRQYIVGELLPTVYKRDPLSDKCYGPHDLAALLAVFAIGALLDLSLPPYNLEAQHYYRLSRAAFCLQPALIKHSVITVKALHLMSLYNGMSGKESNLDYAYSLLNLAGQIALRVRR